MVMIDVSGAANWQRLELSEELALVFLPSVASQLDRCVSGGASADTPMNGSCHV